MKRLSELRGELSGAQVEVLDLLEAHDDRPMSDIDKRRVLNRVRVASRGRRRVPVGRLVTLAALFSSGTLLAAWGAGWIGGETAADEAQAPALSPSGAREQRAAGVRHDAPEQAEDRGSTDAQGADAQAAAAPAAEEAASDVAATEASTSPGAARQAPTTRPEATPPGEDPTLVVEAMRALRQKGEPKRAEELLGRYRAANPNGALSEDALALSIEAAASTDPPRAERRAREYLAKYPHGRYRVTAERALRLGTAR